MTGVTRNNPDEYDALDAIQAAVQSAKVAGYIDDADGEKKAIYKS